MSEIDAEGRQVSTHSTSDELTAVDDTLTFTLGGRLSLVGLDADRVEDPVTGEAIGLSDSWSSLVGSARVLWQPDVEWRLFGSVAQAFRAPNLSDMTSLDATSAVETPTLDLEPENYVTVEAGSRATYERFD